MTNVTIVENKISEVRQYLDIVANYKRCSRQEIEKDTSIRGAVERYLYLVIQSTIDATEAYIAMKNYRKPTSLRESFQILAEQGVILSTLEDNLISMVGFRNILAHGYSKINYDRVYDILQNQLGDIEEFASILTRVL